MFDERAALRFVLGDAPYTFEVEGVRVGLLICEDAFLAPARDAAAAFCNCWP